MNGLVRKILKVSQESQHLEEINKMKDSIIVDMERTIKRLREENNVGNKIYDKDATTEENYYMVLYMRCVHIFYFNLHTWCRHAN